MAPSLTSLDRNVLHQIAGFTGFGWTASLLGYAAAVIGYGNGIITRLFAGPRSLLYLGVVLFLTTLGLDRIANRLPER